MRGKYYVYALFESTEDNIKYIGYTAKTPIIRFGQHISECAKRHTPKEKWLYGLISQGKHVGVIELGCYDNMDIALAAEAKFIIEYGLVHNLTNSTKGGEAGTRKKRRGTHAKTIRDAIGILFNSGITVPTDEQIAKVAGVSVLVVNTYNKRYERKSRSKRKSSR